MGEAILPRPSCRAEKGTTGGPGKEKLIARFLSMPSDFHYNEMVKLLGYKVVLGL